MNNFKYGTNYAVFGFFVVLATIIALCLIPGLDVLAWHFLKPEGFWQSIILIAIEIATAWPRIFAGMLIWLGVVAFGKEIS
jgi:hypothetical protein